MNIEPSATATEAPKPIETHFDGYRFRSRTEARWAVYFKALGWRYEYEREGFDLGRGNWYLPDFWLPDLNTNGMWFEVKGTNPTPEEDNLCRRLAAATKRDVLMAVGQPSIHRQIFWFQVDIDQVPRPTETCRILEDRRNRGEFWIEWQDGCASIGPIKGPDHDRLPLYEKTMHKATNAARKARFDGKETF